jgi:predicted enzyme involved in methoxymalonyl-ACP biosynthesis
VDVFVVKAEHVTRVTQLVNKTNQFNLTTQRKTAGEVSALSECPDAAVLAWRVTDRWSVW